MTIGKSVLRMEVGISPSVSCADSSLIRGSLGSLEVGGCVWNSGSLPHQREPWLVGSRRVRMEVGGCGLPRRFAPRNDRENLRAFSVLHVILSDPERSRRGVEESVTLLGKSRGCGSFGALRLLRTTEMELAFTVYLSF